MTAKKIRIGLLFALLVSVWSTSFAKYDVLELPAVKSDLTTTSLVYTVRKFGDRYFATGIRGHILYSDDAGDSWTQADVPVRSSILDIDFASPDKGWAVGHEGVILHSSDGGATWVKQFDGHRYGTQGLAFYEKLAAEQPDNEMVDILLGEMEFAISQGADKPFFRVIAHNETHVHAVGAYGIIVVSYDGGQNWENREHTIVNGNFNHLFDVTKMQNDMFFICGEVGVAIEGDANKETSVAVPSPWEGSFFTCQTMPDGSVLMAGLRGSAFRTSDIGRSWQTVEKPESESIVDAILLSDGQVLIASQNGELFLSSDNGKSFRAANKGLGLTSGIAEVDQNTVLVAGLKGIQKVTLDQ